MREIGQGIIGQVLIIQKEFDILVESKGEKVF